jgi:hypothetical protein
MAKAHSSFSAILVDELDAGRFNSTPDHIEGRAGAAGSTLTGRPN